MPQGSVLVRCLADNCCFYGNRLSNYHFSAEKKRCHLSNQLTAKLVLNVWYSKFWKKKHLFCHTSLKTTKTLFWWCMTTTYFDGLVQERRNSHALAMELHLSCTNPSTWCLYYVRYEWNTHTSFNKIPVFMSSKFKCKIFAINTHFPNRSLSTRLQ